MTRSEIRTAISQAETFACSTMSKVTAARALFDRTGDMRQVSDVLAEAFVRVAELSRLICLAGEHAFDISCIERDKAMDAIAAELQSKIDRTEQAENNIIPFKMAPKLTSKEV